MLYKGKILLFSVKKTLLITGLNQYSFFVLFKAILCFVPGFEKLYCITFFGGLWNRCYVYVLRDKIYTTSELCCLFYCVPFIEFCSFYDIKCSRNILCLFFFIFIFPFTFSRYLLFLYSLNAIRKPLLKRCNEMLPLKLSLSAKIICRYRITKQNLVKLHAKL